MVESPLGMQAGQFDLVSMHWAIDDEQTVQQATASLHHVAGDSHPERLLITESDRAQVGQGSLIGSWSTMQGASQMELPAKVGIELGWGESSVRICSWLSGLCNMPHKQSEQDVASCHAHPTRPRLDSSSRLRYGQLCCRCTTQLHLPGGFVEQQAGSEVCGGQLRSAPGAEPPA